MDVTAVRKEYERLLALFKDVDETKTKLVDELLHKAAFLKVQLDELQKQVATYSYKTFLTSLAVYQTVIKTLNSILGRNAVDEDDEFDNFMKSLGG